MWLQKTPHLRIVIYGQFQGLHGKLWHSVLLLHQRAPLHPAEHLSEQALHTGAQVDRRVLVDAQGHPAIHHPAEDFPYGEDESASGRLAPAELIARVHVV